MFIFLVTTYWYSQVAKFNFDEPELREDTDSFTQVVWKGTKQIGLGLAKDKSGNSYIVAQYFPAGNLKQEVKQNVGPSNKDNDTSGSYFYSGSYSYRTFYRRMVIR